jgi:hypothetical protein
VRERRRRKGSPLDNACKSFRKVVYMYILFWCFGFALSEEHSTKLFARRWRDDLNAELVDGA